jgi:hypothetical protein
MITYLFEDDRLHIFRMIFSHPMGLVMHIFLGVRTCCMRTLNHLPQSRIFRSEIMKESSLGSLIHKRPHSRSYLIPPYQGKQWDLSYEIDHTIGDEDDPSSTYDSPLQRWIDQACGYTFRQHDQANDFSFQHDFLPPTHLSSFHFLIDYISIYAHDRYMLDLSLVFYIIKHRGRYFDEMIDWLHWLYEFT